MRPISFAVAVLLLMLVARPGWSQESGESHGVRPCPAPTGSLDQKKKIAGEWYKQAVEEADRKTWLRAMRSFICSFQHVPHANSAYNIALAAEQLGESEIAIAFYTQYLKYSPYSEDSKAVETRITELGKKVGETKTGEESAKAALEALSNARKADTSGDYSGAVQEYKRYVRLAPLASDSTEVMARILAFEEATQRGETAKPAPVVAALPPPEKPQAAQPKPEPKEKKPPAPEAQKESDLTMPILGWSLVGVGGGLLVTGAVLAVMYSSRAQSVENAKDGTSWSEVKGDYASAPGYGIGCIVSFVLGAGAIVGGGYILLFEVGDDESTTKASLAPQPSGLAFDLSF